jgi:hypothetical protein
MIYLIYDAGGNMKNRITFIFIILCFTLVLTACSAAPASSSNTGGMDGKALVAEKCSECHSADVVMNKKLTEAQWSDLVLRMVGHGLKVSDSEKSAIISYLAETYK